MEIKLNGKRIGETIEDVYVTPRKFTSHFFRKGQGYPISTDVLKDLKLSGIKWIVIIEERKDESKHRYYCPIEDYLWGQVLKEGEFDEQRCVPLKEMKRIDEIAYRIYMLTSSQ